MARPDPTGRTGFTFSFPLDFLSAGACAIFLAKRSRFYTGHMRPSNQGVTASERYLATLCQKSFLTLWSYPNLYTDEGKRGVEGDGHELCDLLIVFGGDVIIFSDKHITFNEAVDTNIAWRRWFKKAIQKSARQLFGAERWILKFPSRIFLDRKCHQPFPFPIQPKKIHRIVVARGIYQACKSYFGGVSIGSLIVNSTLAGDQHLSLPFNIGRVAPDKGFLHVFEDFTLDAVFDELDTVDDFIAYLAKREALLTAAKPKIIATGDEQLLSVYLTKMNDKGEHDFRLNIGEQAPDGIYLDESFWAGMKQNPKYIAKKQADRVSYAWDRLIEHFIRYAHSVSEPAYIEPAVRLMASEPRLRRRQLAPALVSLITCTPKGKRAARVAYSDNYPGRAYIFLVVPKLDSESYAQYRENRQNLLLAYCKVVKLLCGKADFIIGIATEPQHGAGSSEDLACYDVREWTDEMENEARWLQERFSLLQDSNVRRTDTWEDEYPEVMT
jgi:hypothetical protein